MDKQPRALELAAVLDAPEEHYPGNFDTPQRANAMLLCLAQEAADELRRLHQLEQEGWRCAKELDQERNRLHEVNAELVEAVKAALSDDQPYIEKCKAAIAKATGEQQ